jgi:hypothetical protein
VDGHLFAVGEVGEDVVVAVVLQLEHLCRPLRVVRSDAQHPQKSIEAAPAVCQASTTGGAATSAALFSLLQQFEQLVTNRREVVDHRAHEPHVELDDGHVRRQHLRVAA